MNNGDALAHTAQKTLDELKEKISDEDKESIEKAIKELREALSNEDIDQIKEKLSMLIISPPWMHHIHWLQLT